eukprot:CAMPEP_0172459410 /NCGR_PEP_ID=MMETSP1065-20121228/32573_1 /TAXON_ID=265537 /ORGANISM="Amphiprora paludosa, Strain CCMP125" /LENGTH=104 /DNA_ID=CAMNT_0013214083 /DNA_START=91 /DNA_END=402 /DNA_ORIENTATION=+
MTGFFNGHKFDIIMIRLVDFHQLIDHGLTPFNGDNAIGHAMQGQQFDILQGLSKFVGRNPFGLSIKGLYHVHVIGIAGIETYLSQFVIALVHTPFDKVLSHGRL